MAKGRKAGGSSTSLLKLALGGSALLVLGVLMGYGLTRAFRAPVKTAPVTTPAPPIPKPSPREGPRPRPEPPASMGPRDREISGDSKEMLPRLALVVDDLGHAPTELVIRLCANPLPLSVAVLPFEERTRESAETAFSKGKEVLLHMPMEPLGYPGPSKDPGPHAILFNHSESEIRQRVRAALLNVPHRKGVNNHMGSRITPDRTRMTWILEEVKARGYFFVDSRTEKDTVASLVAADLGVPTVQRKVFLDDDKSFAEMERQWERALRLAETEGQVLVIGHIHPETVAALERLMPRSKGRVQYVFASQLAR